MSPRQIGASCLDRRIVHRCEDVGARQPPGVWIQSPRLAVRCHSEDGDPIATSHTDSWESPLCRRPAWSGAGALHRARTVVGPPRATPPNPGRLYSETLGTGSRYWGRDLAVFERAGRLRASLGCRRFYRSCTMERARLRRKLGVTALHEADEPRRAPPPRSSAPGAWASLGRGEVLAQSTPRRPPGRCRARPPCRASTA